MAEQQATGYAIPTGVTRRRWATRRLMAWVCLMLVGIQSIGGIAAVALGAVHADAITALSAYLGAPTLGEFTVIGLYIGFSTKEDQWMQQMADKVA